MKILRRLILPFLVTLLVLPIAPAADDITVPPPRPPLAAFQASLNDVPSLTTEHIVRHMQAMARPGLELSEPLLQTFAQDFVAALGGRPITDRLGVNWLAGNIDQVVYPTPGQESQVSSAISDFGSGLKRVHADPEKIPVLLADLKALVPQFLVKKKPVGPEHKYRYSLSEAPSYNRSILVEDFETMSEGYTDFRKTWYEPAWSGGLAARVQTEHKAEGKNGLTLSFTGPADKYTSVAKIARPFQSIRGMNALRMWIQPHASGTETNGDLGSATIGFIDGSEEIWQMSIPDLLVGTEPFILQIRLADYKQVLRRNNGVIDMENRDFAIWMGGTYSFSIDDIRFVHDPSIPEFEPDLKSAK